MGHLGTFNVSKCGLRTDLGRWAEGCTRTILTRLCRVTFDSTVPVRPRSGNSCGPQARMLPTTSTGQRQQQRRTSSAGRCVLHQNLLVRSGAGVVGKKCPLKNLASYNLSSSHTKLTASEELAPTSGSIVTNLAGKIPQRARAGVFPCTPNRASTSSLLLPVPA